MISTEPKSITILGSTGSIGQSTLKVLKHTKEPFQVHALVAQRNVHLLASQAREVGAAWAVVAEESYYSELKTLLAGTATQVAAGKDAIQAVASHTPQIVMAAIMGAAGLSPVMAALKAGNRVALANKECLVCAGKLMLDEASRHNAVILPVDSEHSALFQVFDASRKETVEKITLTASGGPFRDYNKEMMKQVTPEQAINHPNWSMGAKISVDSATMMNKGLELIEAYHLFPVEAHQIEIVIHPESIIHGMVAYHDGSVLAQLSSHDMCTPIAYALSWPERIIAPTPRLDLTKLGKLSFFTPDTELFPALTLARQALLEGHSAPVILNAANEIAVHSFLKGAIGFLDIMHVVEDTLSALPFSTIAAIEDIYAIDHKARTYAEQRISYYQEVRSVA